MIVRCKCFVANSECNDYGYRKIKLNLVFSQKPETENFRFHSASPSGNLTLECYNSNVKDNEWLDQFKPGTFWYVDTFKLNEPISASEPTPHLALVGIKRGVSLPAGEDGNLKVVLTDSLNIDMEGYFGSVHINQQVYIANDKVYGEYTTIGDLYSVEFIQTTKEGG